MPKTIISTKDVVKTYDTGDVKVTALSGISLDIMQGEMVAVMGPSGCGKTTLLNCLSGIDDITQGEINIEGKNIANLNDFEKSAYRARNIGFVFQFYNLLPVLNALENVELPLLLAKKPQKEARKTALKMLDLVGLKDWATHKPAELSGGQRQRVTVARALANTPAIVFADEPTGDLDSKNSEDIMELLMNLNRCEGITFLIVTHDPNIGKNVPRRIMMKDGRIESDVRNKDYDFECPEAYTDKRFFKSD